MSGKYEDAITIKCAIDSIDEARYLLPDIQRDYTWSTTQIEVLFDSLMRGYPINTFMFWEIHDRELKNKIRFYRFLEQYIQRFKVKGISFRPSSDWKFHAVIDGQQRLTSLYIGLKGTYSYKLPNKRFPKNPGDESVMPSRRLYLSLSEPYYDNSNEEKMLYNFSFLTDEEYKSAAAGVAWFPVSRLVDMDAANDDSSVHDLVLRYLGENQIAVTEYSLETLKTLYKKVRVEPLINYFNETSQDVSHVLDIFLRTNRGGTPLAFSDLLMSIGVSNWKENIRHDIDNLVDGVRLETDFLINRDLILKCALAITQVEIQFRVENFSKDRLTKIEKEWKSISECIMNTFRLVRLFGINDHSLRAKNSIIPIAYYLYHSGKYKEILSLALHKEDRNTIKKWLHMSLLKGVFGGQSDSMLITLRRIIEESLRRGERSFPLKDIVVAFKGKSKDLRFDDDFVSRILKTQKDDPSCFSVLALLLPDLDYTRALDKDHLHPASAFRKRELEKYDFLMNDPDSMKFFSNKENWNCIVNLHLLDSAVNRSKNDSPLIDWVNSQGDKNTNVFLEHLLIPDGAPLEFKKFQEFFSQRSAYMKNTLIRYGDLSYLDA